MITWDDSGSRIFEAGIDRVAFYPASGPGVAWNGLSSLTESSENAGLSTVYIDGQKVINKLELGTFLAKVEAFTYPNEMLPYDGYSQLISGQKRSMFNLSYRTLLLNDLTDSFGYTLHLVYNCLLSPTDKDNESLNADSDIMNFSWNLSTVPVPFPNNRATSHLYLQTTSIEQGALTAIENILYGSVGVTPRFPTISEVLAIFEANAIFVVVDNGDGTAKITGPDDWVYSSGVNQVFISSPSFNKIDDTHILATSY